MASASGLQAFYWAPQPAAEAFVRETVNDFVGHCEFAARLAERMRDETGTRFIDWIDVITLGHTTEREKQLRACGFQASPHSSQLYRQPDGIFPAVALRTHHDEIRVTLKVDWVADFLAVNQMEIPIEGEPFAPLRRATIASNNKYVLEVHERRSEGKSEGKAVQTRTALHHYEMFRRRRRSFDDDRTGFAHTKHLIDAALRELDVDQTCSLFFMAEREYWQRRNRAAQVQKGRQDRLGLGWGNHDHHTYRSSRVCFRELVAVIEKLGLECRERFYAGREAGWGAQVMENPRVGIVGFLDVDLSPEELAGDFAHEPLAAQDHLGTVGLWCGLHGEAFLQAGMHHLECQFDFAALKKQLEEHGVGVMKPFTDYPYLKQAFTEGERWQVSPERVEKLVKAKLITKEQGEQFVTHGAIGSHLENLERNEGYKGFNQKGVSEIIAATDPRKA